MAWVIPRKLVWAPHLTSALHTVQGASDACLVHHNLPRARCGPGLTPIIKLGKQLARIHCICK